jgi:hypothetical protein
VKPAFIVKPLITACKGITLKPVILIELNEINFNFVQRYIASGKLPNFARLIERQGIQTTSSENEYEHLEPWIQWVTAHTGKSFSEHRVFRLGDIVDADFEQIWEFLENNGLKVGAISPMNAKNRTSNAAFFIPDPWTATAVTGGVLLKEISKAVSQAVNDNATSKIGLRSIFWLSVAMLRFVPFAEYGRYFLLIRSIAQRKSWAKAQFLDELLADLTLTLMKRTKPDFASLFLNAGAHIQHHYMFNSAAYEGNEVNPSWLIKPEHDPVYEVYAQYDDILGRFLKNFCGHRIIISTGLHQDPFPYLRYYWRLLNHRHFLSLMGIDFVTVEPRMSRDFLLTCSNPAQATNAARKLSRIVADDNIPMFEVDNRGDSLFVMLTYPHEITAKTTARLDDFTISNLLNHVVFIAIKNGEHNGEGFLIDTDEQASANPLPLKNLPVKISDSFGLQWPSTDEATYSRPLAHPIKDYEIKISAPAGTSAITK